MTDNPRARMRDPELDRLVCKLWRADTAVSDIVTITRLSRYTVHEILTENNMPLRVYTPGHRTPAEIAVDRARFGLKDPLPPALSSM